MPSVAKIRLDRSIVQIFTTASSELSLKQDLPWPKLGSGPVHTPQSRPCKFATATPIRVPTWYKSMGFPHGGSGSGSIWESDGGTTMIFIGDACMRTPGPGSGADLARCALTPHEGRCRIRGTRVEPGCRKSREGVGGRKRKNYERPRSIAVLWYGMSVGVPSRSE